MSHPDRTHIVLFVGDDKESEEAKALLEHEGFSIDVETVSPSHPYALYGTPVLFGLSNRFYGIDGIRIFINNAKVLGKNQLLSHQPNSL